MSAAKKVSEWRVGDTIKVKDKENTVDGKIKSIDGVITIGKQKRQWANVLVPAVLKIENCTHDVLRGREVNLLEYKTPKARKPVVEPKTAKKRSKALVDDASHKPTRTHAPAAEAPKSGTMKFKCCGNPSTMGHADDCTLKEEK